MSADTLDSFFESRMLRCSSQPVPQRSLFKVSAWRLASASPSSSPKRKDKLPSRPARSSMMPARARSCAHPPCAARAASAPFPSWQARATSGADFSSSSPGRGAVQSTVATEEALRRSMPPPRQAAGAGQATGPSRLNARAASERPAGASGSLAASAAANSARTTSSADTRSTTPSRFERSSNCWWLARISSARTCSTNGQRALSSACTPAQCARSATRWTPSQSPANAAKGSSPFSPPGSAAASATRSTKPCCTANCKCSCAATVAAQARWRLLAAASSRR
mmetsp:Transcript_11710/g.37235  ORF Transcript_11710/g.37235 Transcript_11710/m.37235 type:complete len:282 (-) Transcript_11710:263-1108(-)